MYGTEIPRIIPGSREFCRSFGLDLVAFVDKRGLPDFFLTLTAYDGWPHVQATLRTGGEQEYQRRGAVHWHMLLWVEPGTAPKHAVMTEMPRAADVNDVRAAYLRKLVYRMLQHKSCYPSRCFKGSHGKVLSKCKYSFPFKVPCTKTTFLDDEGNRYLYVCCHDEDKNVVPYNPEIATHNIQVVSQHSQAQD